MTQVAKSLVAILLASWPLVGQTSSGQALRDAIVLEEQGEVDKSIAVAKVLIDSNQLQGVELGRAYIILGVDYEVRGEWTNAQSAFEKCLRILARYPEDTTDYASVLDNYAGLYVDTGQLEVAGRMWRRALHFQLETGDHAAAARSLTSLAGVALSQNRVHEAKKDFKRAMGEMQMNGDPTADEYAVLLETGAWLEMAEGHASQAAAGYERSVEVSKRSRGEQHWLVGWEYMLLGKAYAQAGDRKKALADMRQGLEILDHALGRKNPKYLIAEIAYSHLLDGMGEHAEARELRSTAEQTLEEAYTNQCISCSINIAAYR